MNTMEQVIVAGEEFEAAFLPQAGARLHSLQLRGNELLRVPGEIEDHLREPFFWGGYPLAPWCNRVVPEPTAIAGRLIDLRPNFADGTAIHGQVYVAPWQRLDDGRFSIEGGGVGWPWRYRVEQLVGATARSLTIELRLTNLDDAPMPGGLGLHPWFVGRVELEIGAATAVASNTDPEAAIKPVAGDLDMRGWRELRPGIDAAWTDLEPPAVRMRWPELGVAASIQSRAASWIVAASAPERAAIAVEPQTHGPWGLRRLNGGAPGGLTMLAPGETLALDIEIVLGG